MLLTIAIAMAAGIASACGGHASSPAAPTAPVTSAPPPAGSTSGATIAGTVVNALGAASMRTMSTSSSIVVTVVGTSITSTVNGGQFTLVDVPPGRVELKFSSSGGDARLDLDDVAEREEIHLDIRVNGTTIEIDQNTREKVDQRFEIEGKVTNVGSTGLTVGDKQISVSANTSIRRGDAPIQLSDIHIGDRVHVKGTKTAAGVAATEIKVQASAGVPAPQPAPTPAPQHVEMKGQVSAAPTGSCPSLQFTVGSTLVVTNGSTSFDGGCAQIAKGATVEIKGTKQADASVLATRVKVEKREDGHETEIELKGAVAAPKTGACPSISFNIGAKKVSTNSATEFRNTTCATLAVGDKVGVKGTKQADGSVLARRVEKER